MCQIGVKFKMLLAMHGVLVQCDVHSNPFSNTSPLYDCNSSNECPIPHFTLKCVVQRTHPERHTHTHISIETFYIGFSLVIMSHSIK